MLQWEAISWATQAGFKKYDFVRIEPDRLPGIAHFKQGFGGNKSYYFRYEKKFRGTIWEKIIKEIK